MRKNLIDELVLWIENDGDLYNQQYMPIVNNLERKCKKGIYEHDKALKLVQYMIDGYERANAQKIFQGIRLTKNERVECAEIILDLIETNYLYEYLQGAK